MQAYNAVKLAQFLLLPHLNKCRRAVDATAGNGWDSLFLAVNTPDDAIIYSFDIQKSALVKTRDLLDNHKVLNKVKLIEDNHVNITHHIADQVDFAMFNLGYLPGGGHNITTQAATTTKSVKETLRLLSKGGFITIIAYPGHESGKIEFEEVKKLLSTLPTRMFAVNSWVSVNAANKPPILYVIEKIRSE
ncbi:hypothetical protein SDC9_64954 [bioreactor metagenome]|uniref:rRNA methylase n=1 Tax=bioreactor metagenome TaxID=1076179 RepID=A0A644XQN1_9ZZZZ